MTIAGLIFKEMFQRKNQLISSFLAISLGIAVIVAIKNITVFSERAVAGELDALGANILILPKSATVQDYYSADLQGGEIPEEYVARLTNSDLQGLDNLSPKLSTPVELNGHKAVLTGILPRSEFQAKSMWQGALGIFSRPKGCGVAVQIPGMSDPKKTLVRNRVIESLEPDAVLVGADIASRLNISEGDTVKVKGTDFTVNSVLPLTGTVDDGRLFAHLRTVQKMAGKDSFLDVIEIIGCCNAIAGGLLEEINKLLPDARVVTVSQIVQTQIKTNRMMKNLSAVFLVVIVIVGGASIANYMFANVYERRREIGIYMAMGANSWWVVRLFVCKAVAIGIAGGAFGYIIGTLLATLLGPRIAGLPVWPLPGLAAFGILLSTLLSVAASIIPSMRAARIDPFDAMREE
jgi:putative ABC transport system permease protein